MNIFLFLDILAWSVLALVALAWMLLALQIWIARSEGRTIKSITLGWSPLIVVIAVAYLIAS